MTEEDFEIGNDEAIFEINGRIEKSLSERFRLFIQSLDENIKLVYLSINSGGGDLYYAFEFVNIMSQSNLKFWTFAKKQVSSAAIFIFISAQLQAANEDAYALIHRVKKISDKNSEEEVLEFERAYFKRLADYLGIPIDDVYEMANNETTITDKHPLWKKLFWNPFME